MYKRVVLLFLSFVTVVVLHAQPGPRVYYRGAIKEKKESLHRNLVRSITNGLADSLWEETEPNWEDAFAAMEILRYHSPWADARIATAFNGINKRTPSFQRSLLELVYTQYPDRFLKEVTRLMEATVDAKVYAMCGEYLLLNNINQLTLNKLREDRHVLARSPRDEAILFQLRNRLKAVGKPKPIPDLTALFSPTFLPGRRVLFSLQRADRNHPGMAIVRDSSGQFLRNSAGQLLFVSQLARSVNNLPGYLTNGNTPQGLFRMFGFDTSRSNYIGPTTNIQLTMPFEAGVRHFLRDSTLLDTTWSLRQYQSLLPPTLAKVPALYESFYAGMAGRSEIIAHGTTVDADYYRGAAYFPQTPTLGCLCTIETWSEVDGERLVSDQATLAEMVRLAGGPDGYCVVIELNDEQRAVSPEDVQRLIPLTTQ